MVRTANQKRLIAVFALQISNTKMKKKKFGPQRELTSEYKTENNVGTFAYFNLAPNSYMRPNSLCARLDDFHGLNSTR